jgi:hypothetical protein
VLSGCLTIVDAMAVAFGYRKAAARFRQQRVATRLWMLVVSASGSRRPNTRWWTLSIDCRKAAVRGLQLHSIISSYGIVKACGRVPRRSYFPFKFINHEGIVD